MSININNINDTLTPTSGILTVNGDIVLSAAGNGFKIKTGTNSTAGNATLPGGIGNSITVNTNKVTSDSMIMLSTQSLGGTLGLHYISARSSGISFTISSLNILDTSVIGWMIINPAS